MALERNKFVARLVTILLIGVLGFFFEDFKEWVPWLTELQIRSYNWISKLGVRKPRPQWVVAVEFDDATFYDYLKLSGQDPTDRSALAQIIRRAADGRAAVIALDINLSSESIDDSEPRKSANNNLLAAIDYAEKLQIPVVLTFGFNDAESSNRKPLPNVFANEQLPDFGNPAVPYRARTGFDEAPMDRRQIPLVVAGKTDDGKDEDYSSFSLQVVDAYEGTLGISPRTRDVLSRQIKNHQFVYTSFLQQKQFPRVSAKDVLTGDSSALEKLRHRIVLVGGNRHENRDSSQFADDHRLPPLQMRGMYFQANRIEGLLDDRISTLVNRWEASLLDLSLGTLLIYYATLSHGLARRWKTLGVLFIPVVLAYVVSVNLGYVLDFVLPLLLLFIHIFVEHYLDLRRIRSERRAPAMSFQGKALSVIVIGALCGLTVPPHAYSLQTQGQGSTEKPREGNSKDGLGPQRDSTRADLGHRDSTRALERHPVSMHREAATPPAETKRIILADRSQDEAQDKKQKRDDASSKDGLGPHRDSTRATPKTSMSAHKKGAAHHKAAKKAKKASAASSDKSAPK